MAARKRAAKPDGRHRSEGTGAAAFEQKPERAARGLWFRHWSAGPLCRWVAARRRAALLSAGPTPDLLSLTLLAVLGTTGVLPLFAMAAGIPAPETSKGQWQPLLKTGDRQRLSTAF